MNRINNASWQLSFSFGRALQAPALKTWKGQSQNATAAQKALHHRAQCNAAARFGKHQSGMEREK